MRTIQARERGLDLQASSQDISRGTLKVQQEQVKQQREELEERKKRDTPRDSDRREPEKLKINEEKEEELEEAHCGAREDEEEVVEETISNDTWYQNELFESLKKRYEYRVGNVETRIVLNIDQSKVRDFEKHLKINCFNKYIKNFQNYTGRKTQEWMLGIDIDQAEKIIKIAFKDFNNNEVYNEVVLISKQICYFLI